MTGPLRITVEVGCPGARAFELWTSRIGSWWPRDHTVSGDPAQLVMEPGVGGRIIETGRDGSSHEWGRLTSWEPPVRIGYTWYLGRSAADATDVEITFVDRGATTSVRIEHRGWERLGADAGPRRERNQAGWSTLLPYFVDAAAAPITEEETR